MAGIVDIVKRVPEDVVGVAVDPGFPTDSAERS